MLVFVFGFDGDGKRNLMYSYVIQWQIDIEIDSHPFHQSVENEFGYQVQLRLGRKCVILENLSTTTKIESCPRALLGNPRCGAYKPLD